MSRREHLEWCKERALQYVDRGLFTLAIASLGSDLRKHPETVGSVQLVSDIGVPLVMRPGSPDAAEIRNFIEGFN